MPQSPNSRNALWLVVALTLPTLVTWMYFVLLAGLEPTSQIAYMIGKGCQFALPVLWLWYVAKEPLRRPQLAAPGYGEGLAFGLVTAGLMVAFFQVWLRDQTWFAPAEVEIRNKIADLSLETVPRFVSLSLFYAAAHSLMEEYYWRWFVFRRLMADWSRPNAILVSSLGFMAHHVILLAQYFGADNPFTYVASAGVAIGGAYWAWLYDRCHSIGPAWLGHALVDAAIFAIGYWIVFGSP